MVEQQQQQRKGLKFHRIKRKRKKGSATGQKQLKLEIIQNAMFICEHEMFNVTRKFYKLRTMHSK